MESRHGGRCAPAAERGEQRPREPSAASPWVAADHGTDTRGVSEKSMERMCVLHADAAHVCVQTRPRWYLFKAILPVTRHRCRRHGHFLLEDSGVTRGITRSPTDRPLASRASPGKPGRAEGQSVASSAFSGPQDVTQTLTIAAASPADRACGMRASVGRVL